MGRFMFTIFSMVCFLGTSRPLPGQSNVWLRLEKGDALFLDVATMQWRPVGAKENLPARTFVLTKPGAQLKVYRETDIFDTPPNAYFFVEDLYIRTKRDLVSVLTRIEAEQLPAKPVEGDGRTTFGMTYGREASGKTVSQGIPYYDERLNAVRWFSAHQNPEAALLSLKRLLTKFPSQYFVAEHVDRLCRLYLDLGLYGFLFDETRKMISLKRDDELGQLVLKWHETAKSKLMSPGESK